MELYTTLCRTEVHEDEHILEESVDGMDFVAGVLFADAEGKSGTDVTLRVGYYLPGVLDSQHIASRNRLHGEGHGGSGNWESMCTVRCSHDSLHCCRHMACCKCRQLSGCGHVSGQRLP